MESLMNPPKEDKTATWIHMPSRPEVEPRGFPFHAVKKLLADKNKGWEICEAPFISKKQVRPTDDGKTHAAVKNANTALTGLQVKEFLDQSFTELQEFAKEKGITIQGIRSKKTLLEKIEEAGVLFQ